MILARLELHPLFLALPDQRGHKVKSARLDPRARKARLLPSPVQRDQRGHKAIPATLVRPGLQGQSPRFLALPDRKATSAPRVQLARRLLSQVRPGPPALREIQLSGQLAPKVMRGRLDRRAHKAIQSSDRRVQLAPKAILQRFLGQLVPREHREIRLSDPQDHKGMLAPLVPPGHKATQLLDLQARKVR